MCAMSYEEACARMADGRLYLPGEPAIMREQLACLDKLYDFNATRPTGMSKRTALLSDMFAEIGEDCYIEPPLHANWAGKHVHMGSHVYANFGFTLVDDGDIYIGDNCLFGPHVTLATAGHPIDPVLRAAGYQYNMPIHIGRNVWMGAGVCVMPGVTIGDNTVIGAASIVTHDIPAGVVAVGNPCRVLRPVSQRDREYYFKNCPVDVDIEL